MDAQNFRDAATNAIRYWEPRRLVYNLVLAVIVLTYFGLNYPGAKVALSVDGVLWIFVLAVLANVAYCAAYVVDIFAQVSGYQAIWRKYRWILFLIGALLAGTMTRFFALVFFSSTP
jgi:hypothetical protein